MSNDIQLDSEKLKAARVAAGYSVADFCDLLGVRERRYRYWESGTKVPPHLWPRIGHLLDVTVSSLTKRAEVTDG